MISLTSPLWEEVGARSAPGEGQSSTIGRNPLTVTLSQWETG
jgi:hypothetical protein